MGDAGVQRFMTDCDRIGGLDTGGLWFDLVDEVPL